MKTLIFAFFLSLISSAVAQQPLFPNSDFELGNLEGWNAEGEAFRSQPTQDDNPAARDRETSKLQGKYWIGTFENYRGEPGKPGDTQGDDLQGTLTSPVFTITKPFISYLIGGGHHPGKTGIKLVCEGQEFELATGLNSETMLRMSSDVSQHLGKRARLVVYDHAEGGWGHVNVDDFTASDRPIRDAALDFALLEGISESGYPETDYAQELRPQFHFSSRRNWLNDPNGMVYDGQQYHLFFQHNPNGTDWGNMTWGHATSRDMVHWHQHDHALLPYRIDGRSGTIYSGTAIVDHNNSLGKQVGDTKTLCAFYTFASEPKFYQAMAYSTDGGSTWTYWNEGRAVVPNQGFDSGERDPKVFWHEPTQRWVMVLWVQRNPGRVRFFTSTNLTDWEFASDLMRDWAFECMDLVYLPVDGNAKSMKCLLYDADFDYEIGTFDGKQFHSETEHLRAGGGNFYAAQTFNNSPDGRIVQIGWMRGGPQSAHEYGLPFNQQMSFPCELTLRTTHAGVRVFTWPIKEIESLIDQTHSYRGITLSDSSSLLQDLKPLDLLDLTIEFDPQDAKQVVIQLPQVRLTYDVGKEELRFMGAEKDGNQQEQVMLRELTPKEGSIRLRLLVDRLSVEAYADGGEQFSAHYFTANPSGKNAVQSVRSVGGSAQVHELTIHRLKSAWNSSQSPKPPAQPRN